MKIGKVSLSGVSVALLAIQLAIVCSIAAKYLYQRWTCPRAWTPAAAIAPELPMRGRYLSLQLTVDGCQSTLPSARSARFPRDINGSAIRGPYSAQASVVFQSNLKVVGNRLLAIRIPDAENGGEGQETSVPSGAACDAMRLDEPVDFYIAEKAQSPIPLKPAQELWIEVTVPPKGPPRPIQLALKDNGVWRPLAFE